MKTLSFLLPIIAIGLASCDVTEQEPELPMRNDIVVQCKQGAENVGVAAERIPGVCDCSADKLLEGDAAELADMDNAQLQEIVSSCLQESGASTEPTAAEQING